MSSYAGIRIAAEKMSVTVSDLTEVHRDIVFNVIQYAKCLTRPETPDEIDENAFTAQLIHRFGITNHMTLPRIFEQLRKPGQQRVSSLFDFVLLICTYLSSNMSLKIEYAFKVYDIDNDNGLGRPELLTFIKDYWLFNKSEETEHEVKELQEMVLAMTDLNKDSVISLQEFQSLVDHNALLIEFLGQCLPQRDHLNNFKNLMKRFCPAHVRNYFRSERMNLLRYPSRQEDQENKNRLFPIPLAFL